MLKTRRRAGKAVVGPGPTAHAISSVPTFHISPPATLAPYCGAGNATKLTLAMAVTDVSYANARTCAANMAPGPGPVTISARGSDWRLAAATLTPYFSVP